MSIIAEKIRVLFKNKDFINKCKKRANDFTRDRVFTFERITTFIINLARKSLQIEVYNFLNFLHLPECTKQSFSKARQKLDSITFRLLNNELLNEFYSDNEVKTFEGMRLVGVDGSSSWVPKTKELAEKYGLEEGSDVVLARTSIMYDVLNNVTLHASINPYRSSERSLALDHINGLLELNKSLTNKSFNEDLLLFDRGYPSVSLLALLHTKKLHYVMRITHSFLNETNQAFFKGLTDTILTIPVYKKYRPVHDDFKEFMENIDPNLMITLRMVVFDLGNGKKEIIITSLIDQEKFSYETIFKLYGLRWRVEEEIKFHKTIAEIENFSGKTVQAIEQDFFATIFTCNFSSLLMQEAEDELEAIGRKGKHKYKGNRKILIGIVKNELINIFLSDRDLAEYCEILKNRIKKNLVPIIPGRSNLRKIQRKRTRPIRRCL